MAWVVAVALVAVRMEPDRAVLVAQASQRRQPGRPRPGDGSAWRRRRRRGIEFAPDGEVVVGPEFRALEATWIAGMAAMANAGARIVIDEVFLGGAASQQRWKNALGTLQVLWVGVRCDARIAAARELARGDRIAGMAASQAEVVHRGVAYDLQVDTTHTEALECAQAIAARLAVRP